MTSMNKKAKSVVAIFAILLLVYVLLFFVIPFPKRTASYISFVFTIFSIIAGLAITFYAFKDDTTPVSKVYGFPVFRVGLIYSVTQFALGVIICVIAAFVSVPSWIAILIGVILLAGAAIGVIATDNARDYVTELDQKTEEVTQATTLFRINMEGILDNCNNAEYRKELEKLSDAFRYSDPVSSDATKEIETDLENMITELKNQISSGDADSVKLLISRISNTLNERNRICKARKK